MEHIRLQLEEGIEIPLDEVTPEYGGLLTYKGEQVLLYIKDTRKSRYVLEHMPEKAVRFHVAECQTLDRMRRQERFERYVVTTRKDGLFLVEATDPETYELEELEAKLLVCKYCLRTLNYDLYNHRSYADQQGVWLDFSLDEFFGAYSTFFCSKPTYTDQTAPKGGYAPRWARISIQYREERQWTCEKCGVNLSSRRGLLHVHHINGVISDNRHSNLTALCYLCHAQEPNHGRLKPPLNVQLRIKQLRAEQGLVAG
jgi:hypothetical protein